MSDSANCDLIVGDDLEEKVLRAACSKSAWYFNVPNLHYGWTGGKLNAESLRKWYGPLRTCLNKGLIKAYVDLYTPSNKDPDIMDVTYVEVDQIDFRRRMSFRATRKGWNLFRKIQSKGSGG